VNDAFVPIVVAMGTMEIVFGAQDACPRSTKNVRK